MQVEILLLKIGTYDSLRLTMRTSLHAFKAFSWCVYTKKSISQCQTTIARGGERLEPRESFQGEENAPNEKNQTISKCPFLDI